MQKKNVSDGICSFSLPQMSRQIRIDGRTAVHCRSVIQQGYLAGFGIHLDFSRTDHIRRRRNLGRMRNRCLQLDAVAVHGSRCNITQADGLACVLAFLDTDFLTVEADLLLVAAEQLCTERTDFAAQLERALLGRLAGDVDRARTPRFDGKEVRVEEGENR